MLASFPSDQLEQWMALVLKGGHSVKCPCPGCLTPNTLLSSLDATLPVMHGLRTMELRENLTAAMQDGNKARLMFPHATSAKAAQKLAKEQFDDYSFREGVHPALQDFPGGIKGCYLMCAAACDPLHNVWLGPFKRLARLVLSLYAKDVGYPDAVKLLNDRIVDSGKHDGLERCAQAARTCIAAHTPCVPTAAFPP
jgi:hypothetical protein